MKGNLFNQQVEHYLHIRFVWIIIQTNPISHISSCCYQKHKVMYQLHNIHKKKKHNNEVQGTNN